MDDISFKGIVKLDRRDACWYAEDSDGVFIHAGILSGIDQLLEEFDYAATNEGDEIEITVKVNRVSK